MKNQTENRKGRRTRAAFTRKTLRPAEIEQIYGCDMGTLANDRSEGRGPKFYKVGRRIFYVAEDFERWLFGEPHQTVESCRDSDPDHRQDTRKNDDDGCICDETEFGRDRKVQG